MGLLIEGQWHDQWYDTKSQGGRFKRQESEFRHTISPDGPFKPESDRYHLYVSMACPWAHRALIFRKLKDLSEHISVSVVHPNMLSNGWEFRQDDGFYKDHLYDFEFAHQLYTKAKSDYTGRVTVPILWDKQSQTIVNNESSEIIRIFNSAFNELTGNNHDYYPQTLQSEIDAVNERIYHTVNNGVYKAGFATTQDAYKEAFNELFDSLDWIEQRLSEHRYMVGDQITEADWRLFTTLVRFDAVYVGHFKCNKKRIVDYPNMWAYLRELYQHADVATTVHMDQIKRHYYYSHTMINPTQVIPEGPDLDFWAPHDRD
ncbi:glutathione S-transferase family protein [Bermanella marisrubri]|uniref:Predicted glutathione S-transferase n=1 Tax=Bermanella marisrubri TaxID=207949 RepID=Q1MZJ6_9GAMM|nr:glutathione S-transferase family protein [Bermanella marisrubri]EAT11415.1 Predicted glutathione S-transferase [Oceanobacter sp. RED65] [Bermanella marisrubri]QIZ85587.1 glutathione S-transferase family protein [Bermanella marisrubri]